MFRVGLNKLCFVFEVPGEWTGLFALYIEKKQNITVNKFLQTIIALIS